MMHSGERVLRQFVCVAGSGELVGKWARVLQTNLNGLRRRRRKQCAGDTASSRARGHSKETKVSAFSFIIKSLCLVPDEICVM